MSGKATRNLSIGELGRLDTACVEALFSYFMGYIACLITPTRSETLAPFEVPQPFSASTGFESPGAFL